MAPPMQAALEDLLPVLAPQLTARCAAADAGALAQACKAACRALEARVTRLTVVSHRAPFDCRLKGSPGFRSFVALRGLGAGRFPAVRRLEVVWNGIQGEAEIAAAVAETGDGAPRAWPRVTEIQLVASYNNLRLSPVLAALVARCPSLQSLEARGGGAPGAGEGPGAGGMLAALAPAAATLLEARLGECVFLDRDDLRCLGALTQLTRLELSAQKLESTDVWAAAAAAIPSLTGLKALTLLGHIPDGESGTPRLRLAPLSRLRELSLFPGDGMRALAAALAEKRRARGAGAVLSALTSLSLVQDPDIERGWSFGEEGPAPLSAAALRDLRKAAPNLEVLKLSWGIAEELSASDALLPPGITRLTIGRNAPPYSLAQIAPRLRALTVLEAPYWAEDRVAAVLKDCMALEEVAFEPYTFSTCSWEDLEGYLTEQDLSCLGRLPALRRLRIDDGWLLAGPCPGAEAPARLAAWARTPLEDLRLMTTHGGDPHAPLAICGAILGARLTRLSIVVGPDDARGYQAVQHTEWGDAPRRDPARALLALPLFSRLRELEVDLLYLGRPPTDEDGDSGGATLGAGPAAPPAGPAAALAPAVEPLAQAEALLAPLAHLRPPHLRRIRVAVSLPLPRSTVAELEARYGPLLSLELQLCEL